jgi:hypothetical protein
LHARVPRRTHGPPKGPESLEKGSRGFSGLDNDTTLARHEARDAFSGSELR